MDRAEVNFRVGPCGCDSELLDQLSAIEISVPPAGEQRNRARERWAACRLLATIARTGHATFPVSATLWADNRNPDLDIDLGDGSVGVELTNLSFQEYIGSLANADRSLPSGYYQMVVDARAPSSPIFLSIEEAINEPPLDPEAQEKLTHHWIQSVRESVASCLLIEHRDQLAWIEGGVSQICEIRDVWTD